MKVTITIKSRYTGQMQTIEYNAIQISTTAYFVNITADNGEEYSYPHTAVKMMKVTT